MDNKPVYFPKGRDNLTKKYITNLENAFKKARIVLEVLDSRNPEICIDNQFRTACKQSKIQLVSVLTKIDTVPEKNVAESQQKLSAKN
jgi:ribosome biogenesis GTPase A